MEEEEMSDRRTDEELLTMLDESAVWTLNGRLGRIYCLSMNLRDALDQAATIESSRPAVMELRRQPSDKIVISAPQLHRLKKIAAGLERPVSDTDGELAEQELSAGSTTVG
jgi:hypothetical protein